MVEFYRDRNEAKRVQIEPDKKIYNSLLMPPAPETEEKEEPKFHFHPPNKKNSKGNNLIPRDVIYYGKKKKRNTVNPFDSFFIFPNNETINIIRDKEPANKDENLENLAKMKRAKKMEKSIGDLNDSISSSYFYNKKKELNDDKPDEKKLKYALCIRHYAKQLGYRDLKKIAPEEITSIGQIYYLIKTGSKEYELFNNPFDYYNMDNNEDMNNDDNVQFNNNNIIIKSKNDQQRNAFIVKLIKNARIAENNFGLLYIKEKESQVIFKNIFDYKYDKNIYNNKEKETDSQKLLDKFQKIILESQKSNLNNSNDNDLMISNSKEMNNQSRYGELGDNSLYDNYGLVLILRGKRIDFTDRCGKRNPEQFFFKFFLENKLLNTVEVIFNDKVAKQKESKFKTIMKKVKRNQEIIMVFSYYPIIYFNNKYNNYEFPASGVECVYYIDSSIENGKVIEIYKEANKF